MNPVQSILTTGMMQEGSCCSNDSQYGTFQYNFSGSGSNMEEVHPNPMSEQECPMNIMESTPDFSNEQHKMLINQSPPPISDRLNISTRTLLPSPPVKVNSEHHKYETFRSFAKWNCDINTLISIQAKNKQFSCFKCGVSVPDQRNLARHRCVKAECLCSCQTCEKSFSSEELFQKHLSSCKQPQPKKILETVIPLPKVTGQVPPQALPYGWGCKYCSKAFTSEAELAKHSTLIHEKDEAIFPYQCPSCDKAFQQRSGLRKHILVHKQPFKCNHCEKSFNSKMKLTEHSCVFECSQCTEWFLKDEYLQKHMDEFHKPVIKCVCCPTQFNSKEELDRHYRPATGEKKFKCCACQKTFYSKANLLRHHHRLHTGQKALKCRLCDKTFQNDVELHAHMSEHEPWRLKCLGCGVEFTSVRELRQHKKTMVVLDSKVDVDKKEPTLISVVQTSDQGRSGSPIMQVGRKYADFAPLQLMPVQVSFQCDKCNKSFSAEEQVKKHVVFCGLYEDYQQTGDVCEKCNQAFSVQEEFQQHVKFCGVYKPNDCGVPAANNESLGKDVTKSERVVVTAEQLLSPHNDIEVQNDTHFIPLKREFKCPYCEKVRFRKQDIVIHIRSHTGKRPYKCARCKKSYAEIKNLNRHVQNIHGMDVGEKPNTSSGKTFTVVSNCEDDELIRPKEKCAEKVSPVKEHLLGHEQSHSEHPFKCTRCEKAFETEQSLFCHEEVHNIDENIYQCSYCGECIPTQCKLDLHSLIHTGEKQFQCTHCEEAFETKELRDFHEQGHPDKKTFKCSLCEKRYSVKSQLKDHYLRIHIGEKQFLCSTCGKRFMTKTELKTHAHTHTGERPFICSYCEKAFTNNSVRISHVRAVHTREKQHECTECLKVFFSSARLRRHRRIHTGEKPYTCSHCGKGFTQNHSRKAHELTHTGERPFVCDCGRSFLQRGLLYYHKRKCVLVKSETKA